MGEFNFNGKKIYFEEHNPRMSGEPLIVLNGIFMTCASWTAFVPVFSGEFRLILVDFLDQGNSSKMDEEYTQGLQVEVVVALMDALELEKAFVLGISYGGEVAMKLAIEYPGRVERLVLANTCAYTSRWLRDMGRSWEYAYRSYDGAQFFKACIPVVYSPRFYDDNYEWMAAREEMFARVFGEEIYNAFGRLTRSAEGHDARGVLHDIAAPTLVVASEFDYVTPVFQARELAEGIAGAAFVMVPAAGHALMYEKPNEFAAAVLGFLKIKERIRII